MRILDNLYWINGMIYGTLGNAYAIRHNDSLTLIDCGMEYDWDSLYNALCSWGLEKLPIRNVLLTHGHRDHAGNAKRMQDQGAKIYVNEGDAGQLRKGGLTPSAVACDHTYRQRHQPPSRRKDNLSRPLS